MKPGVWFAAGAAAGVYGVVRVRRLAEALTPDGMRDRLGAAVLGVRLLAEEVATAQAEAEVRLREQYRALEDAARGRTGPAALSGPAGPAGAPGTSGSTAGTQISTTAVPAARTQEDHH